MMNAKLTADPGEEAVCSLQEAVMRAAEEAALLAQSVAALEKRIEERACDASLLVELQRLDLVRQGLAGLTTFLRMLAKRADPVAAICIAPILSCLDMEEQAARLAGRGTTRQVAPGSSIDLWQG